LAGSAEAMAVGPQTESDACQADAPTGGHAVERFELSRGPTVVQLSQASVAVTYRDGVKQPASHPVRYPYFSLQATVSGAMLVDSSRERGRKLGLFEGLCSPQQYVEQVSSSTWASLTPTMTSTHATTTTTLTSMIVTCAAVGGPAYVPYVSGLPQGGLTSVCPMRPAVVSQSVKLSGVSIGRGLVQ